jgi:hypothetical protein
MTTQEALNALVVFGDKCVGGGLFKSIGDVLIYKEAVDTVVKEINEQKSRIGSLTRMTRVETKEAEVMDDLHTN